MATQISYNIEQQILKIFPTEKLSFYRTERRGKIYVKYFNKKRSLASLKKPSIEKPPKKEVFVPQGEDLILIQSLKYDDLSSEELYSTWASCAKIRFHQIKNECETMEEIFKLWPHYKGKHGIRLIDIDFNQMHEISESTVPLKEKFIKLFNYLKNKPKTRDPNFKEILDSINIEDLDNDTDNAQIKLMWSLQYIVFQTRKTLQGEIEGKKRYKSFTVRDSQNSFLYINETMQSLENHVEELLKRKQPIQPFVLGLGDVKTLKTTKYLLYLDGQYLPFNSFYRAMDICFKAFHLFNVEYPLASRPMWIFIERFFYGLQISTEVSSKVSVLINDLSKY